MPGGDFDDVRWWPFDATTINRVPSSQAKLLRAVIEHLQQSGRLVERAAAALLERTG